ncbi:hypothetical protein, partial [Paenibacillus sp. HGF5]|uniref:hypothetical protein n=1 Tax=Paenibacillus sp. HGF5 TaxID=908341 RepID=UPI001C305C39
GPAPCAGAPAGRSGGGVCAARGPWPDSPKASGLLPGPRCPRGPSCMSSVSGIERRLCSSVSPPIFSSPSGNFHF